MSVLSGKNILLGISGGIAAYKIPFLIRLLVKKNASVKCVMTSSAKDFITPLTISALSNNFNNWLLEFYDEESKNIRFDFEDEIISSSVLVFNGEVKNERFK